MKSYKFQNKVRGPITWTDYCDVLEKIESNFKLIHKTYKSFKYQNQYLILKVNFDTEIGDYFEISTFLTPGFKKNNFDLIINDTLKKIGLRKWESDIYYKLINDVVAKKTIKFWKFNKTFFHLLISCVLFFRKNSVFFFNSRASIKT